jgi:hypothetical protein
MADRKEELQNIIRQLEGVYKTSRDQGQKNRVYDQLKEIKRELQTLLESSQAEGKGTDEAPSSETPDSSLEQPADRPKQAPPTGGNGSTPGAASAQQYRLIHSLRIDPIHPLADNDEVNFLAAAMKEFEDEYWGALSDYHLTLEYAQSNKRDSFLTMLENNKRHFKEYIKILEEVEHQPREEFKKQLQNMALKQERHVIMETTNFFNQLQEFLENLLADNENHGNMILNPDEVLKFNKLYGEKKLSGMKVIDGVKESLEFLDESTKYLHLPSFYRKEIR